MMLILSFLARFPGFEDHIEIKNQEDLVLKFGPFDNRQLSCYPSTVKVSLFVKSTSSLFFVVLDHRLGIWNTVWKKKVKFRFFFSIL
jgi:hypothetical protein